MHIIADLTAEQAEGGIPVVGGYVLVTNSELNGMEDINLITSLWATQADQVAGQPAKQRFRYGVKVADLDTSTGLMSALYKASLLQPCFTNAQLVQDT